MRIERIRVEERHRNDLGDLAELAASITEHGLLHPVVVTQDGRLVAGARRLEAVRSLGWEDVPATFVVKQDDALALLQMERDENTCRKDMTPSERIALGRALEKLEAPNAKARQSEAGREHGRGIASVPANGSYRHRRSNRDTREVVAPAVGMSTATYSRAKQLITAAEGGDERAVKGVAEMDRSGRVTPAYHDWKGRNVRAVPRRSSQRRAERAEQIRDAASQGRNDKEIAAAVGIPVTTVRQIRRDFRIRRGLPTAAERAALIGQLASENHSSYQIAAIVGVSYARVRQLCRDYEIDVPADKSVGRVRRPDATRIVEQTVATLAGLVKGLDALDLAQIDVGDDVQVRQWVISLTESMRALNRFSKQIKEMTQ
jgi:hypothetical protein